MWPLFCTPAQRPAALHRAQSAHRVAQVELVPSRHLLRAELDAAPPRELPHAVHDGFLGAAPRPGAPAREVLVQHVHPARRLHHRELRAALQVVVHLVAKLGRRAAVAAEARVGRRAGGRAVALLQTDAVALERDVPRRGALGLAAAVVREVLDHRAEHALPRHHPRLVEDGRAVLVQPLREGRHPVEHPRELRLWDEPAHHEGRHLAPLQRTHRVGMPTERLALERLPPLARPQVRQPRASLGERPLEAQPVPAGDVPFRRVLLGAGAGRVAQLVKHWAQLLGEPPRTLDG